jgi:DNA mismatch repair protein MutL
VLGRDFIGEVLPVDYRLDGVQIRGYVTKPIFSKASRNRQYFFVNGRIIRSKLVSVAMEEGYVTRIQKGRYPAAVLYLNIEPSFVDVNVHPAKTEVKFANEKTISEAVYFAIQNALLQETGSVFAEITSPVATEEPLASDLLKADSETFVQNTPEKPVPAAYSAGENTVAAHLTLHSPEPLLFAEKTDSLPTKELPNLWAETKKTIDLSVDSLSKKADPEPIVVQGVDLPFRLIGEAFSVYILIEMDDSLIVIDKHAAHERLIFESLKQIGENASGQILIAPILVRLTKQEIAVMVDEKQRFLDVGFDFDEFGSNTLAVRKVPMSLAGSDIKQTIGAMAAALLSGKRMQMEELWDQALFAAACKAAIKSGDRQSPEELKKLVSDVLSNPAIRYCPHGRPVFFSITKQQFSKQFGRE